MARPTARKPDKKAIAPTNTKKREEHPIEENDLASWAEDKLGDLKPFMSQIAFGVALAVLGLMAVMYFMNRSKETYSNQWRQLNLSMTDARLNQDPARLLDVAERFPDQPAAMWSLLLAGDVDMQTGINQMSYDRPGGLALVKRAKDNFTRIIDAKPKSAELAQRAQFSLAYAYESLGEFSEAATAYEALAEVDSPFAVPAKRGLRRVKDENMIALFDTFKNYEASEEDGEAPGARIPDSPNLDFNSENDFPAIDLNKDKAETPMTPDSVEKVEPAAEGDSESSSDGDSTPAGEGDSETLEPTINEKDLETELMTEEDQTGEVVEEILPGEEGTIEPAEGEGTPSNEPEEGNGG